MASGAQTISAEIITTGTEILLGEIIDTNAAWIAQQLRDAGVNLYYKTTVGDNEARVIEVLKLGLTRSDVLIVTGGLGPTVDDITRQAIAAAAGSRLILDEGALATLQERFDRFGVEMTENNRQQAMIPEGAVLIPNPVGTAPGFIVDTGHGTMIAIPGVPREMKRLMEDTVLPYLSNVMGQKAVIRRRILRTIGIGESKLDHVLGDLMRYSNPTVGLAAKTAQADIRVTARAESAEAADALIDGVAYRIYELVGENIYSETPEESIESVVVRMLIDKGATLALLESNASGHLAARIRLVDGGKDLIVTGLTVPEASMPGAVVDALFEITAQTTSEQVVNLARVLRAHSDADYAIVVLGTSEPGDGVFGSDSSATWVALVGESAADARLLHYGGADEFTNMRISNQALALLWQTLN